MYKKIILQIIKNSVEIYKTNKSNIDKSVMENGCNALRLKRIIAY